MNLKQLIQNLNPSWIEVFNLWQASEDFDHISNFLLQESNKHDIYPPDPFVVFKKLSLNNIRVVILGQDPYHGPGQAHGLAFSVEKDKKIPPSLKNIFKEISRTQPSTFSHGCLENWLTQGVFLLNTTLTVSKGLPASHSKQGWESLTDAVIKAIGENAVKTGNKIAFLLWGAHAQAKQFLIPNKDNILILTANHPSPFSALRPPKPFLGSDHFNKIKDFGIDINWSIAG